VTFAYSRGRDTYDNRPEQRTAETLREFAAAPLPYAGPPVVEVALAYAAAGFKVLPVFGMKHGRCGCGRPDCQSPGKHPILANWPETATTDTNIIGDWFRRYPSANVGMTLEGLVVVDVDPRNGGDADELERAHPELKETCIQETGGGGRHYLFRAPVGALYAKELRHGVDIKAGAGAFIVVEPSLHPSGRRYVWLDESGPQEGTEPRSAPAWIPTRDHRPVPAAGGLHDGGIPAGRRNEELLSRAGAMRRKGMDPEAITAALVVENAKHCTPPLPEAEVRRIAANVSKYPAAPVSVPAAWPTPEPVAERLREVPVLNEDMVPRALRPWLGDIANRMQVPLELVVVPAVVLAGSLTGAGCGIRPKRRDDWLEVPNLWGGIIAPPSSFKSPSREQVFKPLGVLEVEAQKHHEAALQEYAVTVEAHKAREEAAREGLRAAAKGKGAMPTAEAVLRELRSNAPEKPTKRRYRSNDPTVEKLGELLSTNPRGVLVERDELVGFLAAMDKEGRESDRAFYLEAWGGKGSFTTDRIGRGEIHIPRACVAVYGATQPDKIIAYLDSALHALGNDGLLQRFQLLVFPDHQGGWHYRDQSPDHDARSTAYGIFRHIAEMDFTTMGATVEAHQEIPAFRFSDEAQDFFRDWLTTLETAKLRAPDEHPILVEHLGKYRGLMPSLALIFHVVELAAGGPAGPVPLAAAELSARWCHYLEAHARRIYGLVIDATTRAPAELAARIRKGQLTDGFTVRDVYRKGWTMLHTPELAGTAIEELLEAGWLREGTAPEGEGRSGRPRRMPYEINPLVFEMEKRNEG